MAQTESSTLVGSASLLSQVVAEFEHDTDEAARNAARDNLLSGSGAMLFPCVVFRQGGRVNISTAFPLSFVAQHVKPQPASKGGDPRSATNRPLMPDHVKTIHKYLRDNHERYILPPVTLNVRQMPQVHVARTNDAVRAGYLLVPHEAIFYVTDGMHRVAAIAGYQVGSRMISGVLDEIPDELSGDGLAVVIVVESVLGQVHQDFADAAHSKPIPASLLAAYNTREPVNQVLQEVVEHSIFKGRVDETSKTLSKISNHMFLLNQVRSLLKGLLVGDYAVADATFERRAAQDFANDDTRREFTERTLELLGILASEMTPWPKIGQGKPSANLVMTLRPEYLNLTATGLGIIGQVVWQINKDFAAQEIDDQERIALYHSLATRIDWRRDAAIWQGSAVQDGKLSTNRAAVDKATRAAAAAVGVKMK